MGPSRCLGDHVVRVVTVSVATCGLALLAGCAAGREGAQPTGWSTGPAPSAAAGSALPQSADPVELDPADFTADVTNPWFPLEPGTRWT